jgi:hypothetical protein
MSAAPGSVQAHAHQTSPAVFATLSAPGDSDRKVVRQLAISQLSSLADVTQMVPTPYREILTPLLFKVQDMVIKRDKACEALVILQCHIKKKTWPSTLASIHPLRFQHLKEWSKTEAAAAHNQWFDNSFAEYCEVMMKRAVENKQEEVTNLPRGTLRKQVLGPDPP